MKWEPISKAPKDGRWLLVFDPEESDRWSKCSVMRWAENEINPNKTNQFPVKESGWQGQDGTIGYEPEYWMSLPDGPVRENQAKRV